MQLTASLVLYNNAPDQFGDAIRSFLEGSDGRLIVVDNSPAPLAHASFGDPRVSYIFAGENLGFGRGHNLALAKIGNGSDVHLFLNPDVAFGKEVLDCLLRHLELQPDVGAIMPRIQYPDGTLQRLCKLLPSPIDLFSRRFIPLKSVNRLINRRYELHALSQSEPSCVPSLSGCFLLVRTAAVREIGGFDARYFMYMEDVDLVRRIGDRWKTVYEPSVSVTHGYAKESYRNPSLRSAHVRSALAYFAKWGWIFDKGRRVRNRALLAELSKRN